MIWKEKRLGKSRLLPDFFSVYFLTYWCLEKSKFKLRKYCNLYNNLGSVSLMKCVNTILKLFKIFLTFGQKDVCCLMFN